jgi:hypothetical protein
MRVLDAADINKKPASLGAGFFQGMGENGISER